MDKIRNVSLPYVNNAKAVFLTIAINVCVVFVFFWPDGVTFSGVILDSLICAAITVCVNMSIVYSKLKKIRAAGYMPEQVPVSRFMQRLPKNPVALALVYIVMFAAGTVGANAIILWFCGVENLNFVPWAAYKLIYSTFLSVIIAEYCIFRYVQPDWADEKVTAHSKPKIIQHVKPVKNPLPKISLVAEMYGSATGCIGMNVILGSILGGAAVGEGSVFVIYPTTVEGIPLTGLVFGCITGILTINGVVNGLNATIRESGALMIGDAATVPDKRFSWMPVSKVKLMLLICPCLMVFSSIVLWAVMMLFEISVMNFLQFSVFIIVYATIIGKPLSYILVKRCTQPDYIKRILAMYTGKSD